ncbi:hypothetical protein OHV64_05220 [Acinetobacter baumannii]|uniref:DUF6882 domain-containing protein n=1 Tax=Acinetobacter baumannii TaxID=470 RepID=UPI002340EA2A|nr:hypothetical protein [Acinetobacter baumannii]MDV7616270.1 hypothetical protein [Acinetobacter baumannii]
MYKLLSSDIELFKKQSLIFVKNRPWDSIVTKIGMFIHSSKFEQFIVFDGNIDETGDIYADGEDPFNSVSRSLCDRAIEIQKENYIRTKEIIWGITFTLHFDGEIKVEYNPRIPEWYEGNPTIDLDEEIKKETLTDSSTQSNIYQDGVKSLNIQSIYLACRKELELKTLKASNDWGMNIVDEWDIDLVIGGITFNIGDRQEFFEINVIGTYDERNQTFMWAWEHPSIPQDLQEVALIVKKYGEQYEIAELQQQLVYCSEEEAWNFTALAAHLAKADGAYRGKVNGNWIYIVFKNDSK